MGAKIISRFNGKVYKEKLIQVDFNNIEKNVTIELELKGIKSQTIIFWEIYSNGEQLDAGDLTRGQNVELVLYKAYAGSIDKPHNFEIFAKDGEGNLFDTLQLSLFEKSIIKRAYWTNKANKDIKEAGVNSTVKVQLEGYGLFGIPILLEVFQKLDTGEETLFTKTIYSDGLQNEESFFLSDKHFDGGLMMNVVNRVFPKDTAELYFTLTYKNQLLKRGEILHIRRSIIEMPESQEVSLKTVVVYSEQYFTQKYEPCKYEKIFYQLGKNEEVEVFDEKKTTKKGKDGKLLNSRVEISVIAPPKKSKNIKDLKIRLEKTETEQCSLNERNKKNTSEPNSEKKSHQGNVIDYTDLKEAEIEVIIEKVDEKATIKPSFNYRYDERSALDFLTHYFLFSTLLDSKDVFQNELKSKLIGWEAENKGLIDIHHIGLQTCRYNKDVNLKIFADVAWAFHGFYNKPVNPRYYMDDKDVIKREGLDEKITWVQNYNQYFNLVMPFGGIGPIDSISDFILELLKDMASNYGLAFTSYYDFNENLKCDKRIEYAKEYPNLFDGLIAGAVTLEILIQVLLLIITEGASAELLLARMSKAGVKMSGKLEIMAKKAERNIEAIRKKKLLGSVAKTAHTVIKSPSISYYKGYRFAYDQTIGTHPLLEERVAFSPLFGIDHEHKKNLGDLIYEKTPVYKIIDLTQKGLEFLTIGFNRNIIRPFNKDLHETVGLSDHYLTLTGDAFGKVNEYLAFVTAELVEKVFGAKAEYSVNVKGGYGMDFELKIHNAENKLNLADFLGKGSVKDASVATIGSSKELKVDVKVDANIKVPVKAMNIINYLGKTNVVNIAADSKFEISTGVFLERRYFFHASEKKPYYQDSTIFTGVAGEYGYKVKVESKPKGGKGNLPNVNSKQSPKKFVLLPPQVITHKPIPVFENPAK